MSPPPLGVLECQLFQRKEHTKEHLQPKEAFQEHDVSESQTYPVRDEILTPMEAVHQVFCC